MNRKQLDLFVQKLKCDNCHNYLLCPPLVQLDDGTTVCGTCAPNFPSKGPDVDSLLRQQAVEYILRRFSVLCKFQPAGCQERLIFGCDNHDEEKCVYRPLICPTGRCPWIGAMFGIHKHLASAHTDMLKNALDFKLLVSEDSEDTIVAVVDGVPFIAKYIYKAEQGKLAFIVNCLTLDQASYKAWMFNDLVKDYGVSVKRAMCLPYTSLPCKGLFLYLNKYLPALENPECVMVKIEMIIEKGDENEARTPIPAAAPAPLVDKKVVQLQPSFVPPMRMTIPQHSTIKEEDAADPNAPH